MVVFTDMSGKHVINITFDDERQRKEEKMREKKKERGIGPSSKGIGTLQKVFKWPTLEGKK